MKWLVVLLIGVLLFGCLDFLDADEEVLSPDALFVSQKEALNLTGGFYSNGFVQQGSWYVYSVNYFDEEKPWCELEGNLSVWLHFQNRSNYRVVNESVIVCK